MPEAAANVMAFFITTVVSVLFFAVIPGAVVVLAGFLVGIVASLPILAVASLTGLIKTDPFEDEAK